MKKSVAAKILAQTLTSPATLAELAARGMFASVLLNMPSDIHNANLTICFKGIKTKRNVLECYAPGDETGWAVVYKNAEDIVEHTHETELIYGVWTLHREPVKKIEFVEAPGDAPKVEEPGAGINLDMVPAAFDLEEIITEASKAYDGDKGPTDGEIIAAVKGKADLADVIVRMSAAVTGDVLESSKAYDDMSEAELLKEIEGVAPYQYDTDAQVEEVVRKNRERAECKAEGAA